MSNDVKLKSQHRQKYITIFILKYDYKIIYYFKQVYAEYSPVALIAEHM